MLELVKIKISYCFSERALIRTFTEKERKILRSLTQNKSKLMDEFEKLLLQIY